MGIKTRLAKGLVVSAIAASVLMAGTLTTVAGSFSDGYASIQNQIVELNRKVTKKDLDNAKRERDRARQRATAAANRLKTLKNEQSELKGELADLNQLSAEQRSQYEVIAGQLAAALEAKADALDRFIEAQDNLTQKKELFEQRVEAMFEFQNKSTIELILESDSIAGFFTNMELMSLIADADAQALDELQIAVDDAQLAVDSAMEEANNMQTIIEAKQAELDELERRIGVTTQALDKVSTQITDEEKTLDAVNAEAAKIDRQLRNMQSQYNAQNRSSSSGRSSGSSSGGSSSSGGGGTRTVSGVTFSWPTASHKITSPFGYRIHPISGVKKMHTGIDIGNCGYGATIMAAADGKVIKAYKPYNGRNTGGTGYGNYVIIDHGNGVTTLYGHCKNVYVSAGQTVSRGQRIATVGSTGSSTGPHLHFEVRINGSQKNPKNYLP